MRLASGAQLGIAHGTQHVVVTELGATLRSYEIAGEPVVWGFSPDEICRAAQGQVLAPWPNRIEDGRYRFGEVEAHAAIDDAAGSNAIHGLVRWLPWRIEDVQPSSCRLSCVLLPQPAYPFCLSLSIEYALGPSGLSIHVSARNIGARNLPFALGFHPYFEAGVGRADNVTITLPAKRRLLLSARGLPTGVEPIEGTPYEVLTADRSAPIGPLVLDACFTGIVAGTDGRWRVLLERDCEVAPRVVLWADQVFGYIQCFTGESIGPEHARRHVAVEPMTAPPNALRSGDGVIVLAPGESFRASFGIDPTTAA